MLKYKILIAKRIYNLYKTAIQKRDFYDIYALELLSSLVDQLDISPREKSKIVKSKNDLLLRVSKYYLDNLFNSIKNESQFASMHASFPEKNSPQASKKIEKLKSLPFDTSDKFEVGFGISSNELSIDQYITLFENMIWSGKFGGEPWANIARLYKDLNDAYKSKDYSGIMIAIDRIHQAEHNTGSIFTNFPDEEWVWIFEALTNKSIQASTIILLRESSEWLHPYIAKLIDNIDISEDMLDIQRGEVIYSKFLRDGSSKYFLTLDNLNYVAKYLHSNGNDNELIRILVWLVNYSYTGIYGHSSLAKNAYNVIEKYNILSEFITKARETLKPNILERFIEKRF